MAEIGKLPAGRHGGLIDPGNSAIDGVDLKPVFDLDFMAGRAYCHRIVNPAAPTATRASAANRYWLQPADDVGVNVLRYAQKSTIGHLNGLLIEGADQNVIIRNYESVYQAGDWVTNGFILPSTVNVPDLYGGGAIQAIEADVGEGYMCQQPTLTAVKWIVAALVYTDGSAVTASDMRMSAAAAAAFAGLASTYEHVGGGVYLVWAVFTATAAVWNVGINVRRGKTINFSLLSCYLAVPTNEGGDFPRSPIPNATGAAITRAADIYAHSADNNIGLDEGTIDVEFVAPCSEAEAATFLRIISIYKDGNNRIEVYYDAGANTVLFRHRVGAVSVDASGALGHSRGDIVKIRCPFGADIEGLKDTIFYASINNAAWSEIASHNGPLGGNLPAGATIYIGQYGTGVSHLGSLIRRVRIFNYVKVGLPGDF